MNAKSLFRNNQREEGRQTTIKKEFGVFFGEECGLSSNRTAKIIEPAVQYSLFYRFPSCFVIDTRKAYFMRVCTMSKEPSLFAVFHLISCYYLDRLGHSVG